MMKVTMESYCPPFIKDTLHQCKAHPDRVCCVDAKGNAVTYKEFLCLIHRTSGYLEAVGIKAGSFVVVNLPNSPEYLAVEFGVWLSGCIAVPVNPLYPKARIDYIKEHCDASLTVNEKVMEEIRKAKPLEVNRATDGIAALFYTSGSTGTPKGVIHTFESLAGRIDHWKDLYEIKEDDRFGQFSPMAFIASVFILPYLRCGASVAFFDRETVTDINLLQRRLEERKVTCTFFSPSLLKQLDLSGNRTLRLVMTGSEKVSNISSQGQYRLLCLYGMTEISAPAFFFEIDKPYQNTPIGKPITGLEACLAEDGEICLRGTLTPGYYKDSEKSAGLWKNGWFHTGDTAKLLSDGNYQFVSRKDWMCKINGQRVETGEVAYAIKGVEGVKDAAVKAFTGDNQRDYLVAYFVSDIAPDAIKAELSKVLPEYMIPAYFVKMAALPLNANGKLDVAALQSPAVLLSDKARKVIQPENEVQAELCKAFETALGISPIGIDDDFFDMGGDSIRVMQLQTMCSQMELSASSVYRFKTPRRIAEELGREVTGSSDDQQNDYPLSQTQTGIFVESMNRRGEAAYNNAFLYKLSPAIDLVKLSDACSKALAAHPNLFAEIYTDENGVPRQKMGDAAGFSVKVETMTGKEFESIRFVQPFDVLADRLFRIRIIKTESEAWLFTDFHHIVFDGTSNEIIIRDIEQAYEGRDVVSEQYTGFNLAADEQCQRGGEFFEECKKWNLETFGSIDRTSLPSPDRFSDQISFERLETLPGIGADAFAKAADKLGVTENVLALATFGYMLGTCCNATDTAFATIYNGRKELKTARTVSMMVKTLPVTFKWDASTTVRSLLGAVKEQLTGAMAHDLFSFGEICAKTAFDSRVIFTYQDELLERETICGERCEMTPLIDNATGEPLAVQLYKKGGRMALRTEYRSNMFSAKFVKRLAECYANVLKSLLQLDANMLASDINLVDDRGVEELLAIGRGDSLEFDRSKTIVDLFRAKTKQHPEAVAVADGTRRMSYSELDSKSDSLALELLEAGIERENFVAVMMPRSVDFTVAFLSCFKCGAAYVPMDYEYPTDRLQYMIEDSECKVLLTTRSIYEQKCREGALTVSKVIFLDEFRAGGDIADRHSSLMAAGPRPEGLAYMIYTSGTTGKPKGVMIEHRSLANFVHWAAGVHGITDGTRVAEHASFSFDGSLFDLMPTLAFGGELHILPAEIRKDLSGIYRYFCDNKIEASTLTTQLGMTMLKMYDLKLRTLVMGGEKLSGKFTTETKIVNGYGPTEFTVASSYYVVDNQNTPDNIPIGKAVPNTISAVVDPLGRLLPRGVAGELVLIGPQLARGYWHREDITEQRFVPCPFVPGEKMYRTGDLAQWSDEGELLYMGRIDTQVKLRGFRIELGEIESTMTKFEGVKTAVAAVKEIGGMQHLIGYYNASEQLDHEQMRAFLASSLTEYMVPTAFVFMETMPLTPNGKVDVRRLPVPEIKADEIVEPSGDVESKLFEIAKEALGNNDFGVTTNLISMGMTSLGAISLSLQIEKKTGLKIPSSKMLEMPTIRKWAELAGSGSAAEEKLCPFPKQDEYPMTDNQLGVYLDWENHRGGVQYNVPMFLCFEDVEGQKVVEAVKVFLEAHPYLKTRFVSELGNNVRQCRHDSDAIEVSLKQLEKEPDLAFFQGRVRPFDLYGGPLCRFEVYTFQKKTYLISDIHHIVFDGGSENILVTDIVRYLNGEAIDTEEFTAYDYSLYIEKWKESEAFSQAETYFSSLLEGVVPVSLPSDGNASGVGVGTVRTSVNRESIRQCCRKAGVTENAFFLTAVTQALHRLTRETDIAILTVSSGRALSALEHTAGMFVQTLPIVSHASVRNVGDALQTMHRQVVETVARDKYPFTRIVEKNGLKANILVAYQGDVLSTDLRVGGSPVELNALSSDTAKVPVSINITPRGAGSGNDDLTELVFEYDRALFSEDDVRIFAEAVTAFADNLALAGADDPLASVACVDGAAASQLITVGSGEKMAVKTEDTIVRMFLRQAAANPRNRAVVDEASFLTYEELDRASDILAAEFVSRGIVKDSFVALMLPRRKEYAVAFMAVYKSGGAYVPMDYEYPIDRLQYMLEDSQSRILVTTRDLYAQKSKEGELKVENILFIDDLDLQKTSVPIDNSAPSAVAYMIYTSGTTGRPKGVMVEHRGLVNTISWYSELCKVVPGTRVAEHPSFSFDASALDLMTTLACGGELHILGEALRKDPDAIYKYFIDKKIEGLAISTQLGTLLLSSYDTKLRYMMLGGEKLTGKFDKGTMVINGYGPTEFTVCSSYYIVDPENTPENIPIGRAVPNTVSAIVDPSGNLLPMGASGELALIGPQLARGYWNKPEITQKRFVDCPFISGEKMYLTGDLARWNSDGQLLFMGRIDTQVKLRGFRIELGEIESVMANYPDILSAVAQVKEIGGVQHLCAYFTASTKIDTFALKSHLAESLTSYMVPDALMQLDEMPLTPNGKINTKVLPVPDLVEQISNEFEAPEGEVETAVANAFAAVLGLNEAVSRNASFFMMGGTSLQVMKVIVRLADDRLSVTYGDVFKYPTPRTLAAFLDGVDTGRGACEATAAAPVSNTNQGAVLEALKFNNIASIGEIGSLDDHPVGDVLLLGATGYLGVHILHELLVKGSDKVYCLVRPKKGVTCEGRLKSYLTYYFDNTFSALFGKRLFIIEGDLTEDAVMAQLLDVKVDTVINCAANVKHFAAEGEIEKINLHGTETLIEFCLKSGSRLIQTSTHSVSGMMDGGEPHTMLESDLDFGQKLMTKYQESKFLAERSILDAVSKNGLKAKIMRLGNLMPRYSDGEFQINLENNGFMARMRAYYLMGCIGSSHLHTAIEFAHIDETASAVLTLARTPDRFTVFHPFNNHNIFVDDIVSIMRKCGLDIKTVDDSLFATRLNEVLQDDHLNPFITTLVAYGSHNNYVVNPPSLDFTVNVLNAMDWRWSITEGRYLSDVFDKLKALDYFDR